jgi:hypothetical protein
LNDDWLQSVGNATQEVIEHFTHEDKCGLFFKKQGNEVEPNNSVCHQDICSSYMSGLGIDLYRERYGLDIWKKSMDYDIYNRRIGGRICGLLTIYGSSSIVPILLNLIFHSIIFYYEVKCGNASRFEAIFVLLLIYPQYRCIKAIITFFRHHDEEALKLEKELYERNIESIEPCVESGLQVVN